MTKDRRGMQGKFYTIKAQAACKEEGIAFTPLPKGVAGHMVVVLNRPDIYGNVKFATITSKAHDNVPYYPIAPAAKRPYPFQLQIRYYNNQFVGPPSALPLYSYLRVEEHMVSLEMLVELYGDFGEHLMLKKGSVDKLMTILRA